ncbi:MAG: hypothetical protein GF381_02280 [Candidatus Pacebacteria bacterium]|nr:hypothetical protein [Candidatus Paceibacterota bacterium]
MSNQLSNSQEQDQDQKLKDQVQANPAQKDQEQNPEHVSAENQEAPQKHEVQPTSSTQPQSADKERQLSDYIQTYLADYRRGIAYQQQATANPIKVDELASKLATVYEKVRRIIDWKEENLVRRTAIERILKRTLLSEISGLGLIKLDAEKITEPLIMEVVRSGYFTQNRVSRNKIPLAKQSLAKYIYILNNSPLSGKNGSLKIKEKINFYNWILEIAACEIEEVLEPAFKENALMNLMTNVIYDRLRVKPKDEMTDQDKLIQTYVAVHRTLYSLDEPIITYNLIKFRYPKWFEDDPDFISQFTQNIESIKQTLEEDLNHSKAGEFFKICEHYDAAYLIIGDFMKLLEEEPEQIEQKLSKKTTLHQLIDTVYKARLKTLKKRLFRSAIYSTLSIFAAGIVSFIIFEGPVARLVHGHFSWFALLVDLGVPSLLMFILVATIRPPKKENLGVVKEEVEKIIYPFEGGEVYEINLKKRRNFIFNTIFGLISLVAGTIAAYGIYLVFKLAGVPWTSIYVDTVNVAMVIFAAMVIRHKAKEITIAERGSVINMVVDLFSLPLAKVGQWFSEKWKEYNILSVFFTALVDAPFSMVIAIIEDWRSFLRDKRSEIH